MAAYLSSRIGTCTEVLTWPEPEDLLPGEALQSADLVVQATSLNVPLALKPYPCLQPVPAWTGGLHLVYNPVQTEFLRRAGVVPQ